MAKTERGKNVQKKTVKKIDTYCTIRTTAKMVYFEKKRHETSIENNNSNNIATVHIIIAAKATEKENERIICEL